MATIPPPGTPAPPPRVVLRTSEVLLGSYRANCDQVVVTELGVEYINLRSSTSRVTVDSKFDVRIAFVDMGKMMVSSACDQTRGRYLFLDVSESSAARIANCMQIDRVKFRFDYNFGDFRF